jgi:hypothetical protein
MDLREIVCEVGGIWNWLSITSNGNFEPLRFGANVSSKMVNDIL